ncbi:MAG: SPOR domain-containing protein [Bdellovibrio sp.]|nr:MAG: SPOR domain-containing protein [Bdellovibrio sp.]
MADKSNKADTVVKLMLIFLISLLSFSVGTFVGEQFTKQEIKQAQTTEEYNRSTASTEEAISEEEAESLAEEFLKDEEKTESHKEASHKENHTTPEGYTKYTSPENEEEEPKKSHNQHEKESQVAEHHQATEEHSSKQDHSKEHAKMAEHSTPSSHHQEMKHHTSPMEAANRVAHDKAPSKDIPKRKLASTLPSVASSAIGKYTIQVASYATEKEAKEHAARLKSKGLQAFFVPAQVKGKTWYRVSIGLFPSQSNALKYQKELQKQAGVHTSIIQKIVK